MKIKICGFMDAENAQYASQEGCDYIGINFSPLSKRNVTTDLGKEIAAAARQNGAEPVAVVVDESHEEILTICKKTGIKTIQLHGTRSKSCCEMLAKEFAVIYAVQIKSNGSFEQHESNQCVYLYDNLQGGSGKPFNWSTFSPPSKRRWILAGGLTPDNVAEAIVKFKPYGVDVASGVERGFVKDRNLIKKFIQNVKGCT